MNQKVLLLYCGSLQKEHSKLKTSVFIASIGVIAGIVPYIAASRILVELLKGNEDFKIYSLWLGIGLLSYILKSFLYSTTYLYLIKRLLVY